MKRYKISYAILCFGLFACTKDFEELNENPNRVTTSGPESLLAEPLYDLTSTHMRYGHRIGAELVQYSVQANEINEFHRYVIPQTESNAIWQRYYTALLDAEDMHQRAEENEEPNYLGIAKIIKSWGFSNLTDIFGPVPYHEALQGDSDGPLQPAFDSQEEIYQNLLAELEAANDLLDPDESINETVDLLYQGDLLKWKKFANSLRLRLLLRVSNKPEMNAGEQIREIFESPGKYPVFTNDEDAAIFYFTGTRPNINLFYDYREFEFKGNRGFAELFINTLKELNDPRLEQIATQDADGGYTGVVSGRNDAPPRSYSTYLDELAGADQPGPILSYAEVEFIWAEAALKGWINSDAKSHYEKGIESSMAFWGVSLPDDYLDQPDVQFDGEQSTLMLQKWIALFYCGMEGWNEYRRTGLPELTPGPGARNDGIVPTRLLYPSILQSLNAENYQQAVAEIGADDLKTLLWWQR